MSISLLACFQFFTAEDWLSDCEEKSENFFWDKVFGF